MPELMKASAMLLISLSVQMSAQAGGDETVSGGEAARLCRHYVLPMRPQMSSVHLKGGSQTRGGVKRAWV